MIQPIRDIAQARAISYVEAEEFCRAVYRHFVGRVPPYPVVARAVCEAPSASAQEIAGRLKPFWAKVVESEARKRIGPTAFREVPAQPVPMPKPPAAPREAPPVGPKPESQDAPRPIPKATTYTARRRKGSPPVKVGNRPPATSLLDRRDLETLPYDTNSRLPKNPLRSENRVEQAKLSTCPHGVPLIRRCAICTPDEWA